MNELRIYVDGNYLIINEYKGDEKFFVNSYEYGLKWSSYKSIVTKEEGKDGESEIGYISALEISNTIDGGKIYITDAQLQAGMVLNNEKEPFSIFSLTTFLRNYTAVDAIAGQGDAKNDEEAPIEFKPIKTKETAL